MFYKQVLLDGIEEEKEDYEKQYTETDRKMLGNLLKEINEFTGMRFEYLAELDEIPIKGVGHILSEYITKFDSNSIKSILISVMVNDRIKDCDRMVYNAYLDFKESKDYITEKGKADSAHIYVRYDNAFKHLKPKRLKKELSELICSPRDAFYLPFTVRMLASWKVPEIKNVLIAYLDDSRITSDSVGLKDEENEYFPSLEHIRRELKFTAIEGLKYYPTEETIAIVKEYTMSDDKDINRIANKVLKKIAFKDYE